MAQEIERTARVPFKPRTHQKEVMARLRRFSVLVCHRRFGKTVLAINLALKKAMLCPHPRARVAYIAPFREQAKRVAWDYLKHYARDLAVSFNESELRCDLPNDARVRLAGSDNPDALRGEYFDYVILDEYAQHSPSLFPMVIRPMLADREGGALFLGTPQGVNHFHEVYHKALADEGQQWAALMYRASETGIINPEELEAARREMTPEAYAQEFECSWSAAIMGAYYGSIIDRMETDGRVCSVPYDPGAKVITAWDLGVDDSTAIWFVQRVGREVRVIDYYEARGEGLPHFARVCEDRGYLYEAHIMPHDVEAREWGSGAKTRKAMAEELGFRNIRVAPKLQVDHGIELVRRLLPQCVFDAKKTAAGLQCLRQYRTEYDERRGAFKTQPLHDWTSHAADAFRYLASMVGSVGVQRAPAFVATDNSWGQYQQQNQGRQVWVAD